MNLYVYCLVGRTETSPVSVQGIDGVFVRRLDTEDFSILVSDFPEQAVLVSRENVLAHASVIQNVLSETTPLPFRFGTLVSHQQLENYLDSRRDAIKAKLDLVSCCVEMSVKIISDRTSTEEPLASGAPQTPGAAFLSEKRREILGDEARVAEARSVAEWLQSQVTTLAKETQITMNPTRKLLVAAAHLIERDRVEEFRTRITEARNQRPGLHFLVSGPWAPYSFANIDLEFKTHFGVS